MWFSIKLSAQNYNLPPNIEPGKCYTKCFHYDRELEWKEVDCSEISVEQREMTKKELVECEQKKIKLEKYQEKLKGLGYKINITGIVDSKTIIAHHKYLKVKKKEEKRRKRIEKRKSK